MHTNPEVLALLALGEDSATPDERAHVEMCPMCAHELAELAHLAGVGRTVEGAFPMESPSPEVWRRIQAELGFIVTQPEATQTRPPEPPAVVDVPSPNATSEVSSPPQGISDTIPGTTRNRRLLALVLAAAIALIAGVGIGLGWNSLSRPTPTIVAEAELTPAVPAWDGSAGEATLERNTSGQQLLVVRLDTPRPVPGARVVWLMDRTYKKMQPVGILTSTEGEWTVPVDVDLTRFSVIDISDEPFDGVPTHSGNSIVRGTFNI